MKPIARSHPEPRSPQVTGGFAFEIEQASGVPTPYVISFGTSDSLLAAASPRARVFEAAAKRKLELRRVHG